MPHYQFTIKPEHTQYVHRIISLINAGAIIPKWSMQQTKDGTIFLMEFDEQYQVNKFDKDLKVSFPYLFIG